MLRPLAIAIAFLVLVVPAHTGEKPESNVKAFARDIEQLNGSWKSPTMQFAPGITGRCELKLEFKKDSTVGQAAVLNFVSKNGVFVKVGPSWTAELKEKDTKRFIVLGETKDGKRVELSEIAYQINGDKLTLTSSKALQFEKDGKPIEMSGEWERKKEVKK